MMGTGYVLEPEIIRVVATLKMNLGNRTWGDSGPFCCVLPPRSKDRLAALRARGRCIKQADSAPPHTLNLLPLSGPLGPSP